MKILEIQAAKKKTQVSFKNWIVLFPVSCFCKNCNAKINEHDTNAEVMLAFEFKQIRLSSFQIPPLVLVKSRFYKNVFADFQNPPAKEQKWSSLTSLEESRFRRKWESP